jgi:hypothetical protein
MADIKDAIVQRLTVLIGLDVSGVSHAADMLTMQFGPLRQVSTRRGALKQVGAWSLHVQCNWQIERAGSIIATQDDLSGADDEAHRAAGFLYESLAEHGPATVESIRGSDSGGVSIGLSSGLRMVVTPSGSADEEDWRFFAPGVDGAHFVIEGGRIAPDE